MLLVLVWLLTILIPIDVSNPGASDIPVSTGNGIVLKGWMSILAPLPWLNSFNTSCASVYKTNRKPIEEKIVSSTN